MSKLGAAIAKEFLLLGRDRAGLLVLFLMPAVLVLVVSLVQENVMKTMFEASSRILLVDNDGGLLGQTLEERLSGFGGVTITKEIGGRKVDEQQARKLVQKGDFQAGIIIPAGSTEAAQARIGQLAAVFASQQPQEAAGISGISIYFDPALQGGYRAAVLGAIQGIISSFEMSLKVEMLSDLIPQLIGRNIQLVAADYGSGSSARSAQAVEGAPKAVDGPLIAIHERSAIDETWKLPTSVQQNVPAWALFGVFFIVVPMAGGIIRERRDGVFARLLTLPVSPLTLVSGKVFAYLLVCLAQFTLIFLLGRFLLPLLGTPVLEMGGNALAVMALVLASCLAATGFGILLGTLVTTFEQASMLGAISVVIAAALGGIMVPVYAMPAKMQALSIISPLAWGHSAFLELFVRGGTFWTILPELTALLGIALGSLLLAWVFFIRRGYAA
jgi:ABC-2 type transport system permease protein